MLAHDSAPSLGQVAEKLRGLISGTISREEASAWASPWISRFEEIQDEKVRKGLEGLAMADSPSTDRPYLYGVDDFKAWLEDLTEISD